MTKYKHDYSHLKPDHASPQSEHYMHFVSLKDICENIDNMYEINPYYQREVNPGYGWDAQLINTVLRGAGIGLFEGYKHYLPGKKVYWEIMDGGTRIEALRRFRRGEFKTWSPATKVRMQSTSQYLPIEGGLYFDQLSVFAKSCFLDYHIPLNKSAEDTIEERTTRFQCLNAGHPLSQAEWKHVHPSHANLIASELGKHPFWDDFYTGDRRRKKLFLSSLYLLALQIDPIRMVDLRRSLYIDQIAVGKYDDVITDTFVETVKQKLGDMSILYAGMQFTDRATAIIMYQSVHLLHQHGYSITQEKHKGVLASWLANMIVGSKAPGMPGYNMPVQKILSAKGQQEFWERHLNTVLALVRCAEFG